MPHLSRLEKIQLVVVLVLSFLNWLVATSVLASLFFLTLSAVAYPRLVLLLSALLGDTPFESVRAIDRKDVYLLAEKKHEQAAILFLKAYLELESDQDEQLHLIVLSDDDLAQLHAALSEKREINPDDF